MAFFDFFWEKIKYYTDTSAQNAVSGVVPGIISGINTYLTETNERLRRIETKQKETSIQLEEIDGLLQDNGNETALVDALISLADTIGDFYLFAAEDQDSPLFEQAQMMWNNAKNDVEAVGLELIEPSDEPFDFRLHSAEGAEQDIDMPNGYVIKPLKFGYIYQDKVIRRAAVIINKIKEVEEVEGIEEIDEIARYKETNEIEEIEEIEKTEETEEIEEAEETEEIEEIEEAEEIEEVIEVEDKADEKIEAPHIIYL